ncbi:MAG: HupE/UreJ family protein [Paracoccaceae bacterium]
MIRALALAIIAVLWAAMAHAHALQPGYLELRALGDDTWSVFWRKPDVQGEPMALDARLPEVCGQRTGPEPRFDGGGWSTRWITTCPGGLDGGEISIEGLENTRTDVLVRYELEPGQGQAWRLVPGAPAFTVPETPGAWEVLQSYLYLGVEHILLGLDHLAFVLTLLLLIGNVRRLIGAVTAFTLAHSVTLGAAALGWLSIPGPPVEAVIALSILFVASEILHKDEGSPRLSRRAPWLVSFGFGLIHGLGFGSALTEIGLPPGEVVLALLAFNIGVELGQILFIIACLTLWAILRQMIRPQLVPRLENVVVYAVGSLAAFWFFERLAGFA